MPLNLMKKENISMMQSTGVVLGPTLLLTTGMLGLMSAQEKKGKGNKTTKWGMWPSLSIVIFNYYNESAHAENCPMQRDLHLQEKVKLFWGEGNSRFAGESGQTPWYRSALHLLRWQEVLEKPR